VSKFILKIQEHIQDPLFLISLAAVFLTLLRAHWGPKGPSDVLTFGLLLLFLASAYFTSLYLKSENKNIKLIGLPTLIFIATLFSYYASTVNPRDYIVFTLMIGVFLFFYNLSAHKILKLSTSLVIAICISTMISHAIPGYSQYFAALDPYWYYK